MEPSSWPPPHYIEPANRETLLAKLAADLAGGVVTYGQSVQGRPLLALHLPAYTTSPSTPSVLCCANLHGLEWIGGLVALELARATAVVRSAAFGLRSRADVWIVPCANPDGYAATFFARGDAPLAKLRTNANGVDLNRNFPRPTARPLSWAPGAGSSVPGAATFRGSAPLCEPESLALVKLMLRRGFTGSANLHSFMGTWIPARVRGAADFAVYRSLHRAFNQAQQRPYARLSSRFFDVFTGEQEDFQHHMLGTWAACIEVFTLRASLRQNGWSSPIFWRFNPHDPAPWLANDVGAVANFLLATLEAPPPTERFAWLGSVPGGPSALTVAR